MEHKLKINHFKELYKSLKTPFPPINFLILGMLIGLEQRWINLKTEQTVDKAIKNYHLKMDELSELAQKSYKDLMDLGMNVDSRFSAEIFSVAANLLNHSISAKTAKINKKLKMVDLQLKQAQLEQKERALAVKKGEDIQQGEGVVLDRNELLQELLKKEPPKE